jgi:hypothetical protein
MYGIDAESQMTGYRKVDGETVEIEINKGRYTDDITLSEIYYNTKTHKFADGSQHDFTYTYEFDVAGKDCEYGVTETATCTKCGIVQVSYDRDHNYERVEYSYETTCGKSVVPYYKCRACGKTLNTEVYWELRNHHNLKAQTIDEVEFETLPEALSDLEGLGIYGGKYVQKYICSKCGLTINVYRVYSYTEQFGCRAMDVYNVVYAGTDTIAAFSKNTLDVNGTCCDEKLKYEFEYLNKDDPRCGNGVEVKRTCSLCGTKSVYTTYDHVYKYDNKHFSTSCDENMYINSRKCRFCNYEYCNYYLHARTSLKDESHSWDLEREDGEDEVELPDRLKGIVPGMFYCSADAYYCSDCGMKHTEYSIYSYTEESGCLRTNYIYVQYDGNKDYVGFEYFGKMDARAEHYETAPFDVDVSAEALANMNALTKELYTIDLTEIEEIRCVEYRCAKCNILRDCYIYADDLSYRMDNNYLRYTDINKANILKNFNETIKPYVNEDICGFNLPVNDSFNMSARVEASYYSVDVDYQFSSDELGAIRVQRILEYYWSGRFMHSMEISYVDYETCTRYRVNMSYEDGEWIVTDSYTEEAHEYDLVNSDVQDGESCLDRVDHYECTRCGASYRRYYSGHDFDYVNQKANFGLFTVYAERICTRCGYYEHLSVSLSEDVRLDEKYFDGDATLGEMFNDMFDQEMLNITFDLNGHTLDLCGEKLVIYADEGGNLVFTDNEFDTYTLSSPTGSAVIDSVGGGALILLTDGGDIDVGCVDIQGDCYFSDNDTIESFSEKVPELFPEEE